MQTVGIARLWSKIDRSGGPDSCWPWTAGKDTKGYGCFNESGRNRPAHRVVLEQVEAPPSEDRRRHFALHSCDNPECCNPKHLRWGTPLDNGEDASRRARLHVYGGKSKPLSEDLVRKIREAYASVPRTRRGHVARGTIGMLAQEFEVGAARIKQIVARRSYRWVPPNE